MKKIWMLLMLIGILALPSVFAEIFVNETFENNSIINWGSANGGGAPFSEGCTINSTGQGSLNGSFSINAKKDGANDVQCARFAQNYSVNHEGFNISFAFKPTTLLAGDPFDIGLTATNTTAGTHADKFALSSGCGSTHFCYQAIPGGDTGLGCNIGRYCNITIEVNATDSGSTASTVLWLHVNGTVSSKITETWTPDRIHYLVFQSLSTGSSALIDDIRIYNSTPFVQPPSDTLNISAPLPLNGTQYNVSTININATVNSTSIFNATLWMNRSIRQTREGFAAGSEVYVEFNLTFGASTATNFSYFIEVGNQTYAENSSERGFIIVDTVVPTIIFNSFVNNSVFFNNRIAGNFNFSDSLMLFAYNISIDNIVTLASAEDLNVSSVNISINYNASNLSVGNHTLRLRVADGHTDNEIPVWDVDKNIFTKKLTFDFGDDFISIKPTEYGLFDSFDAEKKIDRYSFVWDRDKIQPSFSMTVVASKRIYIAKNKHYKGWLVVPELNKWLDFENDGDAEVIDIKQIDANTVVLTFDNAKAEDIIFNSIGELNIVNQEYQIFTGNITFAFTTPILESEVARYSAVFTYNSSFISDINISFLLNGTQYGYTSRENLTGLIRFNLSKTTQNVDLNTNISVQVNYTISGAVNNEFNQTFPANQTILALSLGQCSDGSTNTTLVMIPKNEETDTNMGTGGLPNATLDATFELFLDQNPITTAINTTFDFPLAQNYTICLEPYNQTLLANAFLDYDADGYSQRNYFLSYSPLGNGTRKTLNLFLINDSIDSDVTIEVTDEDDLPLSDLFVKVLRYSIGNNSFKTVEVARTSNEGKTVTRLILRDVFYKFIIDDANNTLFVSNTQKVLSTSLFFQIKTKSDFVTTFKKLGNLDYSLTNTTSTFLFVFNDNENIVRSGCLKVIRADASYTNICNTCVNASAGSISCFVNTSVWGNNTFVGSAYIDSISSDSQHLVDTLELNFQNTDIFGSRGLIITMMLMTIMAGIAIWRPTAALVFGGVSILGAAMMGLVNLTQGTIIIIEGIIILFIGLMRD